MKEYAELLCDCPLFKGIGKDDISEMLECLGAKTIKYKRGQVIFSEGEPAENLGVVLSGAVKIERDDFYGNRSIISKIMSPNIFGEAFACAGVKSLPVNAVAAEDTEVMLISTLRITQTCTKSCGFHNSLIFNLLKIIADKNLMFHRRIEVTSKRTTRDKLLTYLSIQAKISGSSFTIPFNRQELADYLDVDRSGLSSEIGKLRREGVIDCVRSRFTLKQPLS